MPPEAFCQTYGSVALVTGASSGIGWAFAEELAKLGLDLVLSARRTDRLQTLSLQLSKAHGTKSTIVEADLSEPSAPEKILKATANIDVGLLVSNAGFNMKGAFESKSASSLAKLLMVNCHAPMQLAHGFIPRLKARQGGGMIFTSSVEGLVGSPYSAAYSASKALVNSLSEGLWGELSGLGIDVLALCPGATESEATTLRGIEGMAMQGLQPAADVARLALENIRNGPIYTPNERYKEMYDEILSKPRRQALRDMAENLKKYS